MSGPPSRKRAKADSCPSVEDDAVTDILMSSPMSNAHDDNVPLSYASVLRSEESSDQMTARDVVFSDGDVSFLQGQHGLSLNFADNVLAAFNSQWKSSVIINLIGRPNSVNTFDFILRGLQRKWKSNGGWKLIDLLNDYFIVKFELEADMNAVLCGGPWILAGQTLVVRKWRDDFDARTDKIGSMAIWCRIIGLPIRYFNKFALSMIGKLLGTVVKVDNVTLQQERGRFARICIEINLDKPLKPTIEVDGTEYGIQYEGISLICFNCGVYGHAKDKCPKLNQAPDPQQNLNVPSDPEVPAQPNGNTVNADGNSVNADSYSQVTAEMPKPSYGPASPSSLMQVNIKPKGTDDGLGPWMLIDYKARKRSSQKNENRKNNSSGSRFNILQTINSEVLPVATGEPTSSPINTAGPSYSGKISNGKKSLNPSMPQDNATASPSVSKSVPEIIQMWSCLQSKIKEKSVLTKGVIPDIAIDVADKSLPVSPSIPDTPLSGKPAKPTTIPKFGINCLNEVNKNSSATIPATANAKIKAKTKSSRKKACSSSTDQFKPPADSKFSEKGSHISIDPRKSPIPFPGFFGGCPTTEVTINCSSSIHDASMTDLHLHEKFNLEASANSDPIVSSEGKFEGNNSGMHLIAQQPSIHAENSFSASSENPGAISHMQQVTVHAKNNFSVENTSLNLPGMLRRCPSEIDDPIDISLADNNYGTALIDSAEFEDNSMTDTVHMVDTDSGETDMVSS